MLLLQVGFLISPVLVEHSGQYWCRAEYGGRSSEYGVSLNVLLQTRSDNDVTAVTTVYSPT